MTKKKLEKFRKILTEKMEDLINEAHAALGDMTENKETYADPTDLASYESDQNFLLRIGDRKRKLILKIRGVLDKIDAGNFGTCEICGEEIPEARLLARPETSQCIECKTEMEEQGKTNQRVVRLVSLCNPSYFPWRHCHWPPFICCLLSLSLSKVSSSVLRCAQLLVSCDVTIYDNAFPNDQADFSRKALCAKSPAWKR